MEIMKKLIYVCFVALLATTSFTSCKKESIKGQSGENGLNGSNGTNGTNGQDGNANVVGTGPISVTSGSWSLSGNTYYVGFIAQGITQEVANNGIVMVYRQVSNSWKAMPETTGSIHYFFSFSPEYLYIYVQSTSGAAISNPSNQLFRAVFISPSQIKENPNTDWQDYEQVRKLVE